MEIDLEAEQLRFKRVRLALKQTQKEFAESLGTVRGFIGDIENGRKQLSRSLIINAAQKLRINPTWLLIGEGEMFLDKEPEDKDDFPDDPEQGAAMLDHLLDLLIKKGVINESDIPLPLPGVRRVNYADKMTKETYRMLQRQLAKAQEETERTQREAERAQREVERIKSNLKRYEARYPESDEVSEPEEEYEARDSMSLEEKRGSYDEEGRVNIPLVGCVAAGPPLDTEAWPDEWIRVLVRRGESPDTHYLLEIKGTSMSEMGISDGALILVRRAERAESGEIAVVYLLGEGVTLKRISNTPEGRINLEWQDGSGRSRELGEEDLIQGVFVRVV